MFFRPMHGFCWAELAFGVKTSQKLILSLSEIPGREYKLGIAK